MKPIRIAQIGMNRYSHAPEIFTTMKLHPEVFDLVGYAVVEDERETEELEGGLLFLVNNEAAGFITGVVLPIDGGFSAYSGV
jgi:hypothetical protein